MGSVKEEDETSEGCDCGFCQRKGGKMTPLLRSLAFAAPASFTYLVLAPLACGCKEEK